MEYSSCAHADMHAKPITNPPSPNRAIRLVAAAPKNMPASLGYVTTPVLPEQIIGPFDSVHFACHPEQAFFAQRRIWASRATRRVLCDALIARLARFLIKLTHDHHASTSALACKRGSMANPLCAQYHSPPVRMGSDFSTLVALP